MKTNEPNDIFTMSAKEGKGLYRLNVVQTVFAVVIAGATVLGGLAVYVKLPAQVDEVKSAQTNLSTAMHEGDDKIWTHMKETDTKREADHEILVRVDERLKSISKDQEEIKQDIKALRAEKAVAAQ